MLPHGLPVVTLVSVDGIPSLLTRMKHTATHKRLNEPVELVEKKSGFR